VRLNAEFCIGSGDDVTGNLGHDGHRLQSVSLLEDKVIPVVEDLRSGTGDIRQW
jgi:hypothetical protein